MERERLLCYKFTWWSVYGAGVCLKIARGFAKLCKALNFMRTLLMKENCFQTSGNVLAFCNKVQRQKNFWHFLSHKIYAIEPVIGTGDDSERSKFLWRKGKYFRREDADQSNEKAHLMKKLAGLVALEIKKVLVEKWPLLFPKVGGKRSASWHCVIWILCQSA